MLYIHIDDYDYTGILPETNSATLRSLSPRGYTRTKGQIISRAQLGLGVSSCGQDSRPLNFHN